MNSPRRLYSLSFVHPTINFQLDEQLRLIALRGASTEEVEELLEDNDGATTGDFLDEIVQMEGVQGEHVYDKRVQQRSCENSRREFDQTKLTVAVSVFASSRKLCSNCLENLTTIELSARN